MKIDKETAREIERIDTILSEDGKEMLDSTPMFVEGLKRPITIQERIERAIAIKLSQQAQQQGEESWEEFNDFEMEDADAWQPPSHFELMDEQEEIAFPTLNNRPEGPETTEEANPPKADKSDEGAQQME